MSKLKILLALYSVNIFIYSRKIDRKYFWGPSGPLLSLIYRAHHRVIVASQSICLIFFFGTSMSSQPLSRPFSTISGNSTLPSSGNSLHDLGKFQIPGQEWNMVLAYSVTVS